jgi:hypothetical protein
VIGAEAVAVSLGGRQGRGGWWQVKCPICQIDRLGLKDGNRGLVVNCYRSSGASGCSRADILAALQQLGFYDPATDKPIETDPKELARRAVAEEAYRRREVAEAEWIWDQDTVAVDSDGPVPLLTYFGSRRLLIEPPDVIRFRYGNAKSKRPPAMVARIDHAEFGPIGIHITFLKPDGYGRTGNRITKGARAGGAVRLAEPRPGEWLCVGEGIETTLSIMQACCLPGWATLCADGLTSLVLPPSVHKVVICADNDASGVGQRAAGRAAQRWMNEGRAVRIATPPKPDTDWNDVLMGRTPARLERGRIHA